MGRHSAGRPATHAVGSPRRVPVRWVLVGLALALVAAVTLRLVLDGGTPSSAADLPTTAPQTTACDPAAEELRIVVAAPAAVAPTLQTIAEIFRGSRAGLGERCIVPEVEVEAAVETAAAIADPAATELPDVWVPDSRVWMQRAQTTPAGSARLTGGAQTVARSPLVLAMPRTAAEEAGWPDEGPSWADVARQVVDEETVVVPDPAVSSAGLGLVMTIDTVLGDDPEARRDLVTFVRAAASRSVPDDPSAVAAAEAGDERGPAFPASEQAVVAYNATSPERPLVAVYPGDSQLRLDYAMALVHLEPSASGGEDPDDRLRAALRFQQAVQSEGGQEALAAAGFRGADGSTGGAVTAASGVLPERTDELTVDPGTSAARALGAWQAATLDAQILTVLDVSASMDEPLGDRTRLEVATDAAAFAISLFPGSSEFGLWSFSTGLGDGTQDYLELVPIGSLADPVGGVPRSQAIADALAAVTPTSGTSLYDTTLAAYETAKIAYDADKINSIVLLTDGVNDDDPSITLDELLAALADARDPARPVEIVYVAVGQEVDVPTLERIVSTVGGDVYQADGPEDLEQIYLDAVVRDLGG